jgi:hypothetical protein
MRCKVGFLPIFRSSHIGRGRSNSIRIRAALRRRPACTSTLMFNTEAPADITLSGFHPPTDCAQGHQRDAAPVMLLQSRHRPSGPMPSGPRSAFKFCDSRGDKTYTPVPISHLQWPDNCHGDTLASEDSVRYRGARFVAWPLGFHAFRPSRSAASQHHQRPEHLEYVNHH